MQFEGLYQSLENNLSGIPSWATAMHNANNSPRKKCDDLRREMITGAKAAMSELSQAIVAWNPSYLWLKFWRASLLESLRFYWKHDPSTLLQGVDSLIRNLGLPDEWRQGSTTNGGAELS